MTALLAALLLLSLAPGSMAQEPLLDLDSFPQAQLRIRSRAAEHRFAIWVASTWPQRAQGLMYVRDLPADRGMLFVHEQSAVHTMWMKNTYIPLDMLFIDARGRILRIAAMTQPFSLAPISPGVKVKAVLEIRGGEAARRGIRTGDRVIHPAFSTR